MDGRGENKIGMHNYETLCLRETRLKHISAFLQRK